jgi:hypothetical protein
MSRPKPQSFTCQCGQTFAADVFRSANVTAEPTLKARILAGEFNRVSCPTCGQSIEADVPFLYHDMAANQMVWVYPAASVERADAIREKVRKSYEIVGTVVPDPSADDHRAVVFGIDDLIAWLGSRKAT